MKSPPSLALVLGMIGFVGLRWVVAAHREVSRFVVAGTGYANPLQVPKFLYVFPHTDGYDGEFYWRMATSPWHLTTATSLGVQLSSTYRLNRITYPFLAWLGAGGRASLVSWSLIIVNLLALFVLAQCAITIARRNQRSSWWGLSVLLVPGLVGALSRDLAEIVSVTLLMTGFLAARDRRWWLSGLLLGAGVLTREALLVPVLAFGFVHFWQAVRSRTLRNAEHLTWALPVLLLTAWQLVLHSQLHQFPLLSAGGGNVGVPFVGVLGSVRGWFAIHTVHHLGELAVIGLQLLAFVALTVIAWRRRPQRAAEVAAFVAATALVVCETKAGWIWPFDLRYGVDTMVLAWFFLLETPAGDGSLRRAQVWVLPAVIATLALRIIVI